MSVSRVALDRAPYKMRPAWIRCICCQCIIWTTNIATSSFILGDECIYMTDSVTINRYRKNYAEQLFLTTITGRLSLRLFPTMTTGRLTTKRLTRSTHAHIHKTGSQWQIQTEKERPEVTALYVSVTNRMPSWMLDGVAQKWKWLMDWYVHWMIAPAWMWQVSKWLGCVVMMRGL